MSEHVRPATWADVEYLSDKLRDEDVEELAASGWTPFDALSQGFNKAHICYTIMASDGTPMGITGVGSSDYPDVGLIWMLGTPLIHSNKMLFLRDSKSVVDDLFALTGFEAMYNHTYYKNTLHHRWLKWMGFKFVASNGRFHEFIRMKTCVDPQRG